jgi:hypothetical protein
MTVTINRRFPVYEFVVRLPVPPDACQRTLEQKIRRANFPAPFTSDLAEMYGHVTDQDFSFRPVTGVLGGTTRAVVVGYVVPQHAGLTDVVVTVRLSMWSWLFVGVMWGLFLVVALKDRDFQPSKVLNFAGTLGIVTVGALALHFAETGRIRRKVADWFRDVAPSSVA